MVWTKWSFVQEFFKSKDLEEYRSKTYQCRRVCVARCQQKAETRGGCSKVRENSQASASLVKALKKQDVDSAMSVVGKADPTADSGAFREIEGGDQSAPAFAEQGIATASRERKTARHIARTVRRRKDVAKAAGVKLS